MTVRVLAAENGAANVYAIGRTGFDVGSQDEGGVYTGVIRTDPFSPDGEGGLTHFRRVQIRVRHTGSFVCTVTCYVDNVQTQVWSAADTQADQSITFTQAAPEVYPVGDEAETILEMDINHVGTFIVVNLQVDSDNVTGVFLVESVRIGRYTLRPGKQLEASAT